MAHDKKLHLIAGLAISLVTGILVSLLTKNPMVIFTSSCLATVVAGAGKEIYDSFYPESHTVDKMDAIATFCGGLIGSTLALAIVSLL